LKETAPIHPDHKKLQNALDIVKGVANYVNNSESPDFAKVVELQMQFGKAVVR
jgi:hypothetical protein